MIGYLENNNSHGKRMRRIMRKQNKSYKPHTAWSAIVLVILSVLSVTLACEKSMDTIQGNESTADIAAEEQAPVQSAKKSIDIVIIGVENYMVNNKQTNATDFADVLKGELDNSLNRSVVINGVSGMSAQDITFVMDTVNNIGVKGLAWTKEITQKMVDEGVWKITETQTIKPPPTEKVIKRIIIDSQKDTKIIKPPSTELVVKRKKIDKQ